MNCEILKTLLDVPASEIPDGAMADAQIHLETCHACSKAWRMKRLLSATLKASPAPILPDAAAHRILTRVFTVDTQRRHRRTVISAGLAAVLILGLILGFTLNQFVTPVPEYAVQGGKLILQSERPTTVGVAFDAGSRLKNVRFTIDLPAGMQVVGQPSMRHLSWMGELHKGQNLLKLPVIAHAGTDGLLTAELSQGSDHRTFNVSVLAEAPLPLESRLWHGLVQVFDWRS
ncbi:MAG TPA: hypothetical protein VNF48_06395 [Gammaproteobacteria bacterium]|nr:hypothetical protein [Gammaproteobacteria bacterium]